MRVVVGVVDEKIKSITGLAIWNVKEVGEVGEVSA